MAPVPVDLTKIDYRSLLRRNVPGDGNFMGMRHQRGSSQRGAGLGGILGVAMGLLPKFLSSSAGKHLISAGKEITQELAQGKELGASIKNVASKRLREMTGSGNAIKRRRHHAPSRRKTIKGDSVTVLKPHLVSDTRVNFLSPP